ncbi:efflux RND transporter permease subunit [Bradyrhizobium sp. Pear76]|uniref:efflux RND transporter permease subunit n=1 Tax=Bradyrhizobium oropedii TaxID=1571201 RepID=UPI001E4007B9|nr:efflux RND transporter permease subunit [Bradyrhizobium oropedii]MCC8961906.1 efflux RND transporter permease subunit [Bradyrhizobium oropedii]
MNFLTRFGLARSRFTITIMVGLLVAGFALYPDFPKREDPVVVIRTAVVSALFPGMAPERMENLVAVPIERKIRELAEVKDIRSLVIEGSLVVYVDLEDEVGDVNAAWQRLRDKMTDVKIELPDNTIGPFVNSDFGDVAIATVAITAEGFTQREMKDVADDFRKKLYLVHGVAKVEVLGVQEERVWLEIDTSKLAAVGAQVTTLVKDLQTQNVILPAGNIVADGTRILLEASGDFPNVRAIETMLTRVGTTENLVRLSDVVSVRRDYVSPKVKPIFFNGRPAVVLSIVMQPDQDVTQLGKKLRAFARSYRDALPIGYEIDFAAYQAEQVSAAVNSALSSVAQTFLVVGAIVIIFLGLRVGLIAAMIVPFAVMFSLIGMRVLGIALEQVSIAAIIIALGLLVDNGVVIVEDIISRVGRGMPPADAALASGQQYAFPLLVSSITTVAAFLPLFLLPGAVGEYGFSLGAVVAVTLGGSWIAALYILPALTVWFMGARIRTSSESNPESGLHKAYGAVLRVVLRASPVVLGICGVLVVLSVMQFGRIPKQMFPLSERNQFLIYMNMPDGTDISETENSALKISRWLADAKENPEIASHILYVGDGGPRFYLSLTPVPADPGTAFFLVNTKDYQGAVRAADRAWKYLFQNHPEARFKIKRLAMGGVEAGIVDVEISGPDADRLLALSAQVQSLFRSAPGIRDNDDDWGNKVIKVIVDVNQDRIRQLGLTSEEITQQLRTYFTGTSVSVYREGDNSIPIVFRAGAETHRSIEGLTSATFANNGSLIPLAQVATLRMGFDFSRIRRKNQERTVIATGRSATLTAGELLAYIQPGLNKLDLGGGYQVVIGGEIEKSAETNQRLSKWLPAALVVMVFAIILQFNSFRRTLLTFVTIPLIFVGIPWALLATGQPLSFFGTLGIISLAGIIINNAIVLIDQIDIERETLELQEAVVAASKKRLRPILLTSATTVLGLMPMAIFGGALWKPMAVLMMSGLAVASMLTLLFVPAGYLLLFGFRGKPGHAVDHAGR